MPDTYRTTANQTGHTTALVPEWRQPGILEPFNPNKPKPRKRKTAAKKKPNAE